ncbi:PREDICTED: transcription termination factor MTEF1, chloroplastic [Tarenaya hassleriana]|uniref:transcription termination factor MTEF1, chloroplastic n=1 Tax=Tarenaya hassleriana TaxID=28532 RepID=UPI00053C3D19|nr:PREDICTED: transcription termination factor MTEF1, chloroplastic [Tarenaya hassleriana]
MYALRLLQPLCSSFSSSSSSSSSSANPKPKPLYLKFHTSHRENLRYLSTLGVISRDPQNALPPEALPAILSTVNFLRSKGISDNEFSRLAFLCPDLFSPTFETSRIEPVFEFLSSELGASAADSRGLIVNFPNILLSNVEYCLRPTMCYLQELGLKNLNRPSKMNAHVLNTRVDKLKIKVRFLRSIGFDREEAARVCARMPAIFGYNVEDNLRPKFEFLVYDMEREMEELKKFPQYFGFSLEKRIKPRHWLLKKKNVRVSLSRMLMWNDQKFYSKWKP